MLNREIPFWLSCILKNHGKDAVYFYRIFPGYKTIYNKNGKLMWIGGFTPMPGNYPAITWRALFLSLFKRKRK